MLPLLLSTVCSARCSLCRIMAAFRFLVRRSGWATLAGLLDVDDRSRLPRTIRASTLSSCCSIPHTMFGTWWSLETGASPSLYLTLAPMALFTMLHTPQRQRSVRSCGRGEPTECERRVACPTLERSQLKAVVCLSPPKTFWTSKVRKFRATRLEGGDQNTLSILTLRSRCKIY